MIRVARERIDGLFGLAEQESLRGSAEVADRCVGLARKIGMRYNVRLRVEYRDLYCRGCSVYWVEGRTVRTRLRSGHRTQTCLRCGRVRRVVLRTPARLGTAGDVNRGSPTSQEEVGLVGEGAEEDVGADEGEEN
jgi:RNase P subunit RPR2